MLRIKSSLRRIFIADFFTLAANRFKSFALYLSLPLLLTACGGYTTQVVDTPQTRNLKGWQKPYMVNGKRYDPLKTHHGFTETGVASWYGKDFHGKLTSNGEVYDMYAMTAAHKTLPLGVYVKVRNQANGKEATVRVNDHGPFVKGRIIDLSYAAASQLGIVGPGTAPVRIEALGYRTEDGSGQVAYQAPASYDVGCYAVQVGAFSMRENAQRLAAKLRNSHGAARVQKGMVNGTAFYRVWVGKYDSLALAEKNKNDFAGDGFPGSFVVALE